MSKAEELAVWLTHRSMGGVTPKDMKAAAELLRLQTENDALRSALEKIADWQCAWGPYPETNEAWRSMAIVTAREAVPDAALKGNK